MQPKQATYPLGDILANAITHGIGAALAIIGSVYLIAVAARGTVWQLVSCSVFAATLMLVYICSTLYHSLMRTRARHVFHILDHASIYLLIAGTYTPFCLVSLHGPLGWTIFGIEWGLAVAGVIFKCFAVDRFEVASALVYLAQGWVAVVAIVPLVHSIGWHGLMWMVWRPGLHAGHRLFRLRPAALLSRPLAPVCAGRQRGSLLRHSLLRCSRAALSRLQTNSGRNSRVEARRHP